MKRLIVICLLLLAAPLQAEPVVTFTFDNSEQEALFHKLSQELRCLVCQNQSISDSNAGLAQDLRQEMYAMLQQGMSEQQIIDFMVQRYGDYVLYRPRFRVQTILLWLGPGIVFVFGVYYVTQLLRAQKHTNAQPLLSDAEQQRLQDLRAQISTARDSPQEKQ
jgi:cytochrome c-type biogenesis protein CcmH